MESPKGQFNRARNCRFPSVLICVLWFLFCFPLFPAQAAKLNLPMEAHEGMRLVYSGDVDQAIEVFRGLQRAQPQHPLGYLLEANARWWKIYCEACEIKWNIIDAWKRDAAKGDDEYLALAENGIQDRKSTRLNSSHRL